MLQALEININNINSLMKNPLLIGLYETGQSGFAPLMARLQRVAQEHAPDTFRILPLRAEEIRRRALFRPDMAGLVMPGRTQGQDYRDELGDTGLANIQTAVHKRGMAVLAICAGSYILSRNVWWTNPLKPSQNKIVTNDTPLFDGLAVGAIADLWHENAYGMAGAAPLMASVASVHFMPNLTRMRDMFTGSAVYLGGGAFVTNPHSNTAQTPTSLVLHDDSVRVPHPQHPETRFVPKAVIEFKSGRGDVIFSNIHPEIDADTFSASFGHTAQARANPALFRANADALRATETWQNALFERFFDNAQANAAKKMLALRGPSR